jgi:predicted nucleotidyltransferase
MAEDLTAGLYERAREWATEDERVAAAFVYGSLARAQTHDLSDLDLLIVAQPDQRDALWREREALAERVLGTPAIFRQEPSWQRPFRFQAWRADLVEVDLTYDEGTAVVWEGIASGFLVLVDRGGIAGRLRTAASAWQRPEFDAAMFDTGTWPWLLWLLGRLRHGQHWMVRYGVMDTLNNRVLPLLGAAGHNAERTLAPGDLQQLYAAAPRSAEAEELARSLCATAELYDAALDEWAARTGKPRPRHPLAPGVLDLVRSAIEH